MKKYAPVVPSPWICHCHCCIIIKTILTNILIHIEGLHISERQDAIIVKFDQLLVHPEGSASCDNRTKNKLDDNPAELLNSRPKKGHFWLVSIGNFNTFPEHIFICVDTLQVTTRWVRSPHDWLCNHIQKKRRQGVVFRHKPTFFFKTFLHSLSHFTM